MKTIFLNHPYQVEQIVDESIILALGFFDGIHKGHQKVITTAKKMAISKNCKVAVMSFDQHPSILFQQLEPSSVKYLSPLERKQELLEALGVDVFYVVNFTREFASLTPQEFVDQYIVGLHAEMVVAGFDYTYGKHEIANMGLLDTYSKGRFSIITIPEQRNRFGKIGSTGIRDALIAGDVALANHFLGYTYQIKGKVVHGFGRGGKLLGYPTANIAYQEEVFLPAKGVYVVEIEIDGQWYLAMASIGVNPTFDDVTKLTIEVHILDFEQDIYDKEVRVAWHYFLRPELKFEGIESLINQLKQDEQATRDYYEQHQKNFEVK